MSKSTNVLDKKESEELKKQLSGFHNFILKCCTPVMGTSEAYNRGFAKPFKISDSKTFYLTLNISKTLEKKLSIFYSLTDPNNKEFNIYFENEFTKLDDIKKQLEKCINDIK